MVCRLAVFLAAEFFAAVFFVTAAAPPARAEAPGDCTAPICWEVVNRFRFFTREADFLRHQKAWIDTHKADSFGEADHPVALMQRELSGADGANWARGIVDRTCFDDLKNQLLEPCLRDGTSEKYLKPTDLPVRFTANLGVDFTDAKCVWSVLEPARKNQPERLTESAPLPCADTWPTRLRIGGGAQVRLAAHAPDGKTRMEEITAEARDRLVVGMGDSIASGEGNPERPVQLRGGITSAGFCFHRVLSTDVDDFFIPRRQFESAGDAPSAACSSSGDGVNDLASLAFGRARWLHAPCHRSLYGHQLRTALTLAIEDTHRSVTYLPLGCSGATIAKGLLNGQDARERLTRSGKTASAGVEAQVPHLNNYLNVAPGFKPSRVPDLVLLTVGANDVLFSGLVADVTVRGAPERKLLEWAKQIATLKQARAELAKLPQAFFDLRAALRPALGGAMSRVVYVPYGNPALDGDAAHPCKTTQRGFDLHPAFGVDGGKLADTAAFVEQEMLPRLIEIAACDPQAGRCAEPDKDRMTVAFAHRAVFEAHGFCAASADDPAFDRHCLKDGGTRNPRTEQEPPGALNDGVNKPLSCNDEAADFAPYAPRARWVRTSDDSALTAMSYSSTLPVKASDIHDGVWGLSAVVFGGALHPTAEGHAAMADAALIEARKIIDRPK